MKPIMYLSNDEWVRYKKIVLHKKELYKNMDMINVITHGQGRIEHIDIYRVTDTFVSNDMLEVIRKRLI